MTGIEAFLSQAQLRWSGRLVRMPDTRFPKAIFCSQLSSGSSLWSSSKTVQRFVKEKPLAMQYWSSNLGNNRPRLLSVETLLRDGNIQFWMSTHLRSAAEERKKKSWHRCHFTVSQPHHLWTRIFCHHRTILIHSNSQALTSHPLTRWEIPIMDCQQISKTAL